MTKLVETEIGGTILSCHSVPLDKNNLLMFTGVEEILRCITVKLNVSLLKEEVIKMTALLRICVGKVTGMSRQFIQ